MNRDGARDELAVDMGRGVTVLRCVADFLAARPALPALVSLSVVWSHTDRTWEISGQLVHGTTGDVGVWALALDDAVTTARECTSAHTGAYTSREVVGTLHGHPVRIWSHTRPTRDGDQ